MTTAGVGYDVDEIGRALALIDRISKAGLTDWIGRQESVFSRARATGVTSALAKHGIDEDLLGAALVVKRAAGQINVLVHAVGILVALPKVLEPGEVVESLSLGAGNTGRSHDLVTNRRLAEFTFIDWRGGSESIRQNKIFGDIVALATANTTKRRILYVNGDVHPLRFLGHHRAVGSVLKDAPLASRFREFYGNRFSTVADYWRAVSTQVEVVDLAKLIPALKVT